MSWWAGLEDIIETDVPLADCTWYRLGGPARWFCRPRDQAELCRLLRAVTQAGVEWRVLGAGANVIVRDEGFDGAVIRLAGPEFERVEIDPPPEDEQPPTANVHAGGAADLLRLVLATLKAGLVGLEALAGIPGTVGGAVRMNAGGRYGQIGDHVRSVRLVRPDGRVEQLGRDALHFEYRRCRLGQAIVTGVDLYVPPGDAREALNRFHRIWREKTANQPPLGARSAGCIFKNPPRESAGRLLDRCGLKGTTLGGAQISTRHANFIVANQNARAADVLALMELARRRVRETTGIELEPEVEVW